MSVLIAVHFPVDHSLLPQGERGQHFGYHHVQSKSKRAPDPCFRRDDGEIGRTLTEPNGVSKETDTLRFDVVPLNFAIQCCPFDAQLLGSKTLVPTDMLQCADNVIPLHVVQRKRNK